MRRRAYSGLTSGCIALAMTGCSFFRHEQPPPAEAMPALPVVQMTRQLAPNQISINGDLQSGQRRVTLNAMNTNAAELLSLLAEAAGASIVIAPEIGAKRVSLYLQDVPAAVALAKVIESVSDARAGTVPAAIASQPVFYDLPVNVNTASAGAIVLRFHTSSALADWVVASRLK